MTTHAVCLLVAGYAALQILSGSESVIEESETLVIMEGGEETPCLIKPKAEMALPAKSRGVVTGSAVADPSVCFWTVGGQEV
jgi:hypothetical protein